MKHSANQLDQILGNLSPHPDESKRPTNRQTKEEVAAELGFESVHRMSFNESAWGPSPKVVAAIQQEAHLVGEYGDFADDKLRAEIAAFFDYRISAEHVYTGCSGFEALELAFRALVRPGDEVIVSHPTFGVYNGLTKRANAVLVDVPLKPETFEYDIDGVLGAVNERTKFVLICNPNNPTGNIMKADIMQRLVTELPAHVIIVADEVYFQFVESSNYPDSMRYIIEERPIVIIHTFAKAFGLAGLRLGYGIAPVKLANYIASYHRGFHQNRLAIAAGIAALNDPAHMRKNVSTAQVGKRQLITAFDRLDIRHFPSEANFIVIETKFPAADLIAALKGDGVLVRQMAGNYPHHLRITVGTPEANAALISGIEQFLKQEAS